MRNTDVLIVNDAFNRVASDIAEIFWLHPVLTTAVAITLATSIGVHVTGTLMSRVGKAKPKGEAASVRPIRLRKWD